MENKITILLPYYNRPNFVRLALESLKTQSYTNWQLFFCDDGSEIGGEKILDEILPEYKNVWYSNTNTTVEEKQCLGGSIFGHYLNEFILETESDICIFLCDDDALYPNYLQNLNEWYNHNENQYSFSHVQPFKWKAGITYDQIAENLTNEFTLNFNLNHGKAVHPVNYVDASQVSWRTKTFKDDGIRFNSPQTANLDSHLFAQFSANYGICEYNGFISQFKCVHSDQLSYKTNTPDLKDRKNPYLILNGG